MEIPGRDIDLFDLNKYYKVAIVNDDMEVKIECDVIMEEVTTAKLPCWVETQSDLPMHIHHQVQVREH